MPTVTASMPAPSPARTPASFTRPGSPEASAAMIRRTFATNPAYAAAISSCRTTAQLALLLDVYLDYKGFSCLLLLNSSSAAASGSAMPPLRFEAGDYFTVSETHTAFKLLRRIALSHPSLFPNLAL